MNTQFYFSIIFTSTIFFTIWINHSDAKMSIAQVQNAMKPLYKTCVSKTGVSKDLVAKTHNGEFPPDPALQCYFACLLKMAKFMNSDGLVDIDTIMKQADLMMTENVAKPTKILSQMCYDRITSTESCEMSWEFTKCYHELDASLYLFP